MNCARLKERIVIEERQTTQTPSGQRVGKWVPFWRCWAEVKCKSTKIASGDGTIVYEAVYTFYIRYHRGITAEMRIIWAGRTFQLIAPPVDWKSDRVGLTLEAKELV